VSEEAARKLILARRARFIAAAVLGAGVSASEACTPQPCLEPPLQTSSSSAPQPCLSPPATAEPVTGPASGKPESGPPDAGARDAGTRNAGAPDAGMRGAVKPQPRPMACLSVSIDD
jgi:hypothetical protein